MINSPLDRFAKSRIAAAFVLFLSAVIGADCGLISINRNAVPDPAAAPVAAPEPPAAQDAPEPTWLANSANKKFKVFPKTVNAVVTLKMLSISKEYRQYNESTAEQGSAGWVEAERFSYRLVARDPNDFDFECKRIPVRYPKEIFVSDAKMSDLYGILFPLELNGDDGNALSPGPDSFKIASGNRSGVRSDIVSIDGRTPKSAKEAFEALSKKTRTVFAGTTLFGNDPERSVNHLLRGSEGIRVVGDERVNGNDCWILRSVQYFRDGKIAGLYSRIWIDKKNHNVRRIVLVSDVEAGITLSIEEFSD